MDRGPYGQYGNRADHTGVARSVRTRDVACPSLDEPHHTLHPAGGVVPETTPTFSDALARVRREIWAHEAFCLSDVEAEMVKVPRILMERFTDTLCYVA